jgi:hypothetical protein
MRLEIKHLAAYLPYGLKGIYSEYIDKEKTDLGSFEKEELIGLNFKEEKIFLTFGYVTERDDFVPILRPLSDLEKEIEVNGEKFVPIEFFGEHYTDHLVKFEKPDCIVLEDSYLLSQNVLGAPFAIIEKLFEWHFDVFGLIEKGLAIDINN